MVMLNVWGRIVEGLEEFSVDCSQVCQGVRKTLRLSSIGR
jgi:hypothetical protein